jgi:hypothetical protein
MNVEKKLITPSIAIEMLKNNDGNRRMKMPSVYRYSQEMKNGKWKEDTGELIKISKTGKVLDGQHRLKAVILSGVSIYFHVAYGLSDEIFDVLDTGSLRNAADSFFISGIKNSNALPSMISLNDLLLKGAKDWFGQKNKKLSNSELLDKYNVNPIFWDNVSRKSINWYNSFSKILAPSIIGGMYSAFIYKDSVQANFFMTQLCEGINVTNNTINILRNVLIKDKISSKKMPMDMKLALIIKCWNLYRTNKTVKLLRWDSSVEKFPIIL